MINVKLLSASLELIENEFFNTLSVSIAIFRNDKKHTIQAISKNINTILGFNQEDFINKKTIYSKLIHPDDLKIVLSELENNIKIKGSKFIHKPYRIMNSKGKYIWIKSSVTIIYNEDEVSHFIEYISDVSEEKNSHVLLDKKLAQESKSQFEQLELEKTKLSTIIHSLPDALWIKDKDGKYLACNKKFEDLYGAKESQIIGKVDEDFVNKELANFFREHDLKAMQSNIPLSNYEELTFSNDGHTEYSYTIKTKVVLNDGSIYGILGISRDISEIKKYQDKIIEQKEEFESIFNFSKDGIAIIDLKSNFLNCNDSYCEMLEFPKEELLTKSCLGLTLDDDREKAIENMKQAIENNFIMNFEKRCLTKNNNMIYVNMSISLLPDKKRILLVTKNISDLKFIEEQSKLISMGEMIGNIAHQWRQPLSIISTASTGVLFQKELGLLDDEILVDSMNNINTSAQYLSKTIDDFRNFIKNDRTEELTSIKDALNFAIKLTEASLKNNYINLLVNYEGDITINAIKNELVQCFINIINNAKDALRETTEEENRYIIISTKEVKNSLELTIKDSASGIPNNIIDRVFEPYFTTKHQSLGTGLGLSIVNKILRDKYCANVTVYNESFTYNDCVYYGACFKITFNKEDLSNE